MVCNGIFHTAVPSEISRDGHIASIGILLLCLLGINRTAIPGASAPGITTQGLLHTKAVIRPLSKFTLPITALQNELSHRYGCQNPRLLLISRKQSTNLCNHLCLRQILKLSCLHTGWNRFCFSTAKSVSNLRSQITQSCIKPVSRTALVCKPSVNRDEHLILLRLIVQRLLLIPKPKQLLLAISLADIHAKVNQSVIILLFFAIIEISFSYFVIDCL